MTDDGDVAEPLVLIEDIGPVRRVTMNPPGALNALSAGLIDALSEAFTADGEDPDIAGIVPGPQPSPWGDEEQNDDLPE